METLTRSKVSSLRWYRTEIAVPSPTNPAATVASAAMSMRRGMRLSGSLAAIRLAAAVLAGVDGPRSWRVRALEFGEVGSHQHSLKNQAAKATPHRNAAAAVKAMAVAMLTPGGGAA